MGDTKSLHCLSSSVQLSYIQIGFFPLPSDFWLDKILKCLHLLMQSKLCSFQRELNYSDINNCHARMLHKLKRLCIL